VLPGPIGPVAPVAGIVSVFPPTIVKVPFRVPELTILALIPTGPAFAFPVPIVGITPGINATFVTVPPTDAIQDTPEEKLMVGVPPEELLRVSVPPEELAIAALLMNAVAFAPRDTGLPVTWNATLLPPAPAPI